MRYIVLICDSLDAYRIVDGSEDQADRAFFPRRVLASARDAVAPPPARVNSSGRPRFRGWALRLDISRLGAMARQPLVRWLAAPIVGVPTVYGGYSTMLNFWQGIGVSPSLWLHALAIVAGVTSGVAAIARLRSQAGPMGVEADVERPDDRPMALPAQANRAG